MKNIVKVKLVIGIRNKIICPFKYSQKFNIFERAHDKSIRINWFAKHSLVGFVDWTYCENLIQKGYIAEEKCVGFLTTGNGILQWC